MDPLAEKMPSWSPYAYAFDNPVRFVDPDGRAPFDWVQVGGRVFWDSRVTNHSQAQKYWGAAAIHHAPNAYGSDATNGSGYILFAANRKWVQNGKEYTAPDMATNASFNLEKWISQIGDTGGDFYSNLGGAAIGQSSPFFRPDIDKIVDTKGWFGAMLNSLGIGSFNPKMDFFEAFLGLSQQVAGLADSVPGVIAEQKKEIWYGTRFTGTELTRNYDGQVNGVSMNGETRLFENLTRSQKDSLRDRNKSDSIRYIRDVRRRGDSLLMQMMKK